MKIIVMNWSDPNEVLEATEQTAAQYDSAYVFPFECKQELLEIVNKRAALKKAFDDSMSLVYEYSNKLTREGKRR
jgi:hypothetical protein